MYVRMDVACMSRSTCLYVCMYVCMHTDMCVCCPPHIWRADSRLSCGSCMHSCIYLRKIVYRYGLFMSPYRVWLMQACIHACTYDCM